MHGATVKVYNLKVSFSLLNIVLCNLQPLFTIEIVQIKYYPFTTSLQRLYATQTPSYETIFLT